MNRILTIIVLFFLFNTYSSAQSTRQVFEFEFDGVVLNGVLDLPKHQKPRGIVLIVHGSGTTNAVAQEWYSDVRETIVSTGYATYMWDKMGCGKSGGTFNYNQTVQSSASEVIAAINTLKEKQILGSEKIGLWGISRAGWINPIVISQYGDIKFWISVSGVDAKENFKYLLKQNLRIDGLPKDSIALIVSEWVEGTKISHSGDDFETYQKSTPNLRKNKFWLRFTNGGITEEGYYFYQNTFMKEELDKKTGLQIYIKDFDSILSNIHCPVLALFGEKDMNVDWTKTKSLYERTLGFNTDLTIKSFPNCNHNLFQSTTGGFYEFQDKNLPYERCDGFLSSIESWLNDRQ
ncbi:MAG: alpha/beta hydrolase [Balneolaceae bacterium]|nr:alpha/beta hydrolase [Balneolaceae bacterium]